MKRALGFTLIELMVTIAVIAILAAIAIPSYTDYVRRGRITDAISTLSGMRVKMEQYFQDNRSYLNACQLNTIAPKPVDTNIWAFTCAPAPAAATYLILATGQPGTMMEGFQYTLDQSNARATIMTPPSAWSNNNCGWVLKKDGSC